MHGRGLQRMIEGVRNGDPLWITILAVAVLFVAFTVYRSVKRGRE